MTAFLRELAVLLADVSLKAVLLAGAAGAGLLIFKVRSSNVKHRVWTTVMVGMLLLPLLARVTPGVWLPAWLYPRLTIRDDTASRISAEPVTTLNSLGTTTRDNQSGPAAEPTRPSKSGEIADVGSGVAQSGGHLAR
ncbi:MAG TPA: hypothetical protein VG056_04575, partial [Pirellulales bacterium]|nr:hypothetical protein [Pirellulales bacterium]